MAITQARYGNFDPFETNADAYANVEYSVYPLSQVRPLFFNARVANLGSVVQTGVQLEVTITNNLGYSETVISDPATLSPGDTIVLALDPFTPPGQIADYLLEFVVLPNADDDNPLNNIADRTFSISEAEFARDLGAMQAVANETGDSDFRAGPAYTFTSDAEIHCIGAAISSSSDVGVYFINQLLDGENFDFISETELGMTSPEFFFDVNGGNFHWLSMDLSPVQVLADDSYVPMFHSFGGVEEVFVGISGEPEPITNFVFAEFSSQSCDPCFSETTYMVRMGLNEEFCQTAMNPGLSFVTVSGSTYFDENCDGEFNNGENLISGQTIYRDDNTPIGFSNQQGEFTTYVVTDQVHNLYTSQLSGFSSNTIEVFEEEPVEVTGDFGYCLQSELIDLGVSVSPVGLPPRPGFPVEYEVCVTNHGSVSTGAEVTFDYTNMPNVSVIESDGGTDSGSSITWSIDELDLFQTHCFSVAMQVAVGTPAGTVMNPVASVQPTPPGIDMNVHNDQHSFIHEVVAAYDPNDKNVDYPLVNYTEMEPGEGAELEYLIRFQNTGNFFATFVRVEDELPELLDLSTIEMIHASHDYELIFHEGQLVEWYFDNIMLPDSTSDEPGSHGHIHFRIKTVPDVSLEDVIENSASIFFDFKEPVITEPAITSFVDCSEGSLSIVTPDVICEGDPFTLTSNRPDFDEYVWTINGEDLDGEEVEYSTFLEETVNATLYATNPVCTLTTEIQMPVLPQPSFSVIPEGYTVCGVGEELEINAVGSASWYLNDELVATGDPVVLSESGNYDIVVENECGIMEMNVPVQIVDVPEEISLTYDGEQLIVQPEGSDYSWLLDGLPVSTDGPTYTPTETGNYSVVVFFEGSSCSLSSNVVLITVSVDEILAEQISLFPNPAKDVVTIVLPAGKWQMSLVDASGNQIRNFENVSGTQYDMELKGVAPGAYFVNIWSAEASAVKKLIVE